MTITSDTLIPHSIPNSSRPQAGDEKAQEMYDQDHNGINSPDYNPALDDQDAQDLVNDLLVYRQRYFVISKEPSRLRNLRFLPAVEMTFLD